MSNANSSIPSVSTSPPQITPAPLTLPNGKPAWLAQLAGWCGNCQKPTRHLAFIETKTPDGTIQISDYHFCTNCKNYYSTLTAKANYDLFFANTLSKRPIPVPRDSQYDVITVQNAPSVVSTLNVSMVETPDQTSETPNAA